MSGLNHVLRNPCMFVQTRQEHWPCLVLAAATVSTVAENIWTHSLPGPTKAYFINWHFQGSSKTKLQLKSGRTFMIYSGQKGFLEHSWEDSWEGSNFSWSWRYRPVTECVLSRHVAQDACSSTNQVKIIWRDFCHIMLLNILWARLTYSKCSCLLW